MYRGALLLACLFCTRLCLANGYIWLSSEHASPYSLYRFNLQTHTIDKTVNLNLSPGTRVYNNLAFDGVNLYVGTNDTNLFAKLNPYSGYVRSSSAYAPTQTSFFEDGAYDGVTGTLWRAGTRLVQTTTNGAVLDSYPYARNMIGLECVNGVMYGTDFDNFGIVTIQAGQVVLTPITVCSPLYGKLGLAYDQQAHRLYMACIDMTAGHELLLEVDPVTQTSVVVADLTTLGYPVGYINADGMAWVPRESAEWISRYDGPTHKYDSTAGIAVDAQGNAYVAGSINTSTGDDAVVRKYSPTGAALWTATYNGPVGGYEALSAIAIAPDGGVAVTGRSDGTSGLFNALTLRYSAAGALLWSARYTLAGVNGPDNGHTLTFDAAGNLYVCGYSQGVTGDPDYLVIKYDTAGNEVWVRRYHNTFRDVGTKIALDWQGNVIIGGWSSSGNGLDYVTIKYDNAGNQLWLARYDGPGHWDDILKGMKVDNAGNVYVSGRSWGAGVSWDFGTVKYSPTGQQLWVKREDANGGLPDESLDLQLTGDGVLVTGWTTQSEPDVMTVCYSWNGATRWQKTFKSLSGTDRGNAMAVDPFGNVYLACRVGGQFGVSDEDAALLVYDRFGQLLRQETYNGPIDGDDGAYSIALGPDLSVYLAGSSQGSGTEYDWLVMKFSALAPHREPPVSGSD